MKFSVPEFYWFKNLVSDMKSSQHSIKRTLKKWIFKNFPQLLLNSLLNFAGQCALFAIPFSSCMSSSHLVTQNKKHPSLATSPACLCASMKHTTNKWGKWPQTAHLCSVSVSSLQQYVYFCLNFPVPLPFWPFFCLHYIPFDPIPYNTRLRSILILFPTTNLPTLYVPMGRQIGQGS